MHEQIYGCYSYTKMVFNTIGAFSLKKDGKLIVEN